MLELNYESYIAASKKRSITGVASLIFAIASIIATLEALDYFHWFPFWITRLYLPIVIAGIGSGFGIASVLQRRRGWIVGLIGLVFNFGIFCFCVLLSWLYPDS